MTKKKTEKSTQLTAETIQKIEGPFRAARLMLPALHLFSLDIKAGEKVVVPAIMSRIASNPSCADVAADKAQQFASMLVSMIDEYRHATIEFIRLITPDAQSIPPYEEGEARESYEELVSSIPLNPLEAATVIGEGKEEATVRVIKVKTSDFTKLLNLLGEED